jgi:hypothetical protein
MSVKSRAVGAVPTFLLALAATACGSSEPSATAEASASTSAQPTPEPQGPRIAGAAVAEFPDDLFSRDAGATFGEDAVRAAYDEMVEFATTLSFDPDYFLDDGDNTLADLEPVVARFTPEKAEGVRTHAQNCLMGNDCEQFWKLAYADLGSSEQPYAFMPDDTFVVQQAITAPEVFIPEGPGGEIVVTFTHEAEVHVLVGGAPHRLGMTRAAEYSLVPAPEVSDHRWSITTVYARFDGSDIAPLAADQPAA